MNEYSLEMYLKQSKIIEIIDEAKNIKTFRLEGTLASRPGQFIMLYLPAIGERPFSIYEDNGSNFSLTIANVGTLTSALFLLKKGDQVSYYGPFGKPFEITGKKLVMIGGGYGTAPLTYLAKEALAKGKKSQIIIGARTKDLLLYRNKKYPSGIERHYCTDDGSFGFKGFVTDKLREILRREKVDTLYTVGPELMMKKVVEISDDYKVDCQISLERYMKCGIGICGSCCVDPDGLRMCVEGPCIDKKLAQKITEFGKYHRDSAGRKIQYSPLK